MLAAFKGLTSKGVGARKGKRRGEEKERGRREREGGGKSCMFRGLMLGVKKFSSFLKKIYGRPGLVETLSVQRSYLKCIAFSMTY